MYYIMTELNKLTKKELLNIISKMKKQELIDIINNKFGGGTSENKNVIKKNIIFNKLKLNKKINNAMANDEIYDNV